MKSVILLHGLQRTLPSFLRYWACRSSSTIIEHRVGNYELDILGHVEENDSIVVIKISWAPRITVTLGNFSLTLQD